MNDIRQIDLPEKDRPLRADVSLLGSLVATVLLAVTVRPLQFTNEFPPGYEMQPYAGAGPFAPSLATTASGGAFDARSRNRRERALSACGTTG